MAIYRNIQMSFWTDSKVVDDFTPEDKLFYLYLMTNPHTNLCGCYEISIKQMANELGYSKDSIENLLSRFENFHDVIRYSKKTKELLLLNWHKFNWSNSPKFKKALEESFESIKNEDFRQYLFDLADEKDTVSIPYQYNIDTTDTVTVTDTVTDTDTDTGSADDTISDTKKKRIATRKTHEQINSEVFNQFVGDYDFSEDMRAKIYDWFMYKAEMKKDYKERGAKSLFTEILNNVNIYGEQVVIEAINRTMSNGYQGIVWDYCKKTEKNQTNNLWSEWRDS